MQIYNNYRLLIEINEVEFVLRCIDPKLWRFLDILLEKEHTFILNIFHYMTGLV